MRKIRKRLKAYYYKHWNCLPWFICGLAILIRGKHKQIQLWLNVDCVADNDVVFLPNRRYKQIMRTRKQRR